jgi:hypothetical protein
MSAVNPPSWMQSRTDHPATSFRRAVMALLGGATLGDTAGHGGVVPGYGNRCIVTGSGSTLQSFVDTGLIVIQNDGSAFSGPYVCYNDASVAQTHDPASSTLFRRDIVYAQVLDTAFGDVSSLWQFNIAKGSNNATAPAPLPALPSRAVPLAYVSVDPSITNLTGKVADARPWIGSHGAVRTRNATRLTNPSIGTLVMDDDLNLEAAMYDGTGYRFVTDKGWQSYTPTHAGQGAATFSTNVARWKRIAEKTAWVNIHLATSHAGSGGTTWTVSLPFTPLRTVRQVLTGYFQNSGTGQATGVGLIQSGGSGAKIDIMKFPSNTGLPDGDLDDYTGANIPNGATFVVSGAVEMA